MSPDLGSTQPKTGPKGWLGVETHVEMCIWTTPRNGNFSKIGGCPLKKRTGKCDWNHVATSSFPPSRSPEWGKEPVRQPPKAKEAPKSSKMGFPWLKTSYLYVTCHSKCIGPCGRWSQGPIPKPYPPLTRLVGAFGVWAVCWASLALTPRAQPTLA